ncbi:MAG: hypothetical protein PUJ84_06230 [Mollicutes bacterium]|nr:hypothetical protein [Mollicutes bacterium]
MSKIKIIIIILIYLSAQSFFNPLGVISAQLSKFLFYGFSLIGLFVALRNKTRIKQRYPSKAYWLMMTAIILSVLPVWIIYDQPFVVSLVATLPMIFSYLFFFILLKYSPDKVLLMKFVKIMVVCSFVMYIANMLSFPNMIFGAGQDEYDDSRGFVRLGVQMIEFVVLWIFYSVNQWVISGRKKWFVWIAITGFLVVMSLTRQVILISVVFSFLMILQKAKLWKKIAVIAVVSLFAMFVLPEIPIYKAMMEVSEKQAEDNKYKNEDIRITAWRFYTVEYQENIVTRIMGNGLPSMGNSTLGDKFERTVSFKYGGNGCNFVDVGWAGFYWLYGIFGVLGLLTLLVKASFSSLRKKKKYQFYWLLFIIISSVTSAPILFHAQVVSLSIVLYLIFGNDYERKNQIHSVSHPQLQ